MYRMDRINCSVFSSSVLDSSVGRHSLMYTSVDISTAPKPMLNSDLTLWFCGKSG